MIVSKQASDQDLKGTFGVVLAYILVKSLLASRQAKQAVEHSLGPRLRNGLYRPAYFVFSGVGAVRIVRRVYRGPHRVIYEARGPVKWLLRAGQVACVLITMDSSRTIGPGFFGGPQLKAFLTGGQAEAEPEAQGPPPVDGGKEMSTGSVFKYSRHPNNWFPTSIFLLEPRMTNKRAMFCAMVSIHGLLGSVHEEYRLRAAYDGAYDRYVKKAPFLIGRPKEQG